METGIRVVRYRGRNAAILRPGAAGLLHLTGFCYEGFYRRKSGRRDALKSRETEPRTLILWSQPTALLDSLEDIVAVLGGLRYVVLARELTKTRGNHSRRAPVGEAAGVW